MDALFRLLLFFCYICFLLIYVFFVMFFLLCFFVMFFVMFCSFLLLIFLSILLLLFFLFGFCNDVGCSFYFFENIVFLSQYLCVFNTYNYLRFFNFYRVQNVIIVSLISTKTIVHIEYLRVLIFFYCRAKNRRMNIVFIILIVSICIYPVHINR